jgi:hypothetical protein
MGLFSLIFKIGADSRELNQSLEAVPKKTAQTAEAMANHFRQALGGQFFSNLFSNGLQAVGLGAFGAFLSEKANEFKDKIKEINRGVMLTQLDPETVQRLKNITDYYGGSLEGVAKAMEHVAEAQSKLLHGEAGSEHLLDAMHAFGLGMEDLRNKRYDQIFFEIAKAVKALGNSMTGEQLAAFKALTGRGGMELLPALKTGLDSTRAGAGLISDEDLQTMKGLGEQMARVDSFWKTIGNFFGKVGTGLKAAPVAFYDLGRAMSVNPFEEAHEEAVEKQRRRELNQQKLDAMGEAAEADAADFRQLQEANLEQEAEDRLIKKNKQLLELTEDPNARLNRLEADRRKMLRDFGGEPSARERERLTDLEIEIARAQRAAQGGPAMAAHNFKFQGVQTDSLLSVGNFLGGTPDAQLRSEMQRQSEMLTRIEANTRRAVTDVIRINP